MIPSHSHLVLIPSYNPGRKVFDTVRAARAHWAPVWIVADGSTDGSGEALQRIAETETNLRVLLLPENQGKGAAILHGITLAAEAGFTHALTMDSDGQHPAEQIPTFMTASAQAPDAMILGQPVFDADAPRLRVNGRKISNGWAHLETLWIAGGDSLFGFRVYPISPLRAVMQQQRWMRRFDFDPEAFVRLCWAGVRQINIPTPVRYFSTDEGGISHFNYLRDNLLLTWMHARLFLGFLWRLPRLVKQRWVTPKPLKKPL